MLKKFRSMALMVAMVIAPSFAFSQIVNPIPGGNGSGTVTSVGLALPNIFTVSGSPVTSEGTLTAVLASQPQNTFLAAPVSGAGVPVFRTLQTTDIPAGGITNGRMAPNAIATANIIDGAITQSKLAPNIVIGNMGTQSANTVLAAPDGASGTPTFRTLGVSDLPTGTTGHLLPLLDGANTWTAAQKITTAANSTARGLEIYQNLPASTTYSSDLIMNSIWTNFNGVLNSSAGNLKGVYGFQVNLATGANYQNTFSEGQTVAGSFGLTPSASNTSLGDQVALSSGFYYPYSTLGRVYGLATGGTCPTGCNLPAMIGAESGVNITGTGVTTSRVAFNAINQGTARATDNDAAFQIANGYGSATTGNFKTGLIIQDSGIASDGNLIRADYTGNIGNLIYTPNLTVTGDIINIPSFIVRGTGHIIARSLRAYGSTANCSDGGVCYGSTVSEDKTQCGNFASSAGCLQINYNGTNRYMPIF